MAHPLPSPLGGPPPSEVPLTRSPLVRVIAQVRFSSILRIDTKAGVTAFQERIRVKYPHLEQMNSQKMQVEMGPAGPTLRAMPDTVWRFSDADRSVQLSLTTEAATLEAVTYEGRERFMARWAEILGQIEAEFTPGLALRCGVRYVNHIHDDEWISKLSDHVIPGLVGVAQSDLRSSVSQALSEATMRVEEGSMTLRWGILPPHATIDPGVFIPVAKPSWILDIDVFAESQQSFVGHDIAKLFQRLSERAYAMFRYAVTAEGLSFLGA